MKNQVLRSITAALCITILAFTTVGCEKSTITALTSTLGNAASAIAALEGNGPLATQLKTDTAAAVQAINDWKTGTSAQAVIQALGIVEQDLNLIPGTSQYAPLIDIAIATVQSILSLLPVSTTPQAVHARTVHLGYPAPKTAREFKKKWNAVVAADPKLSAAKIK